MEITAKDARETVFDFSIPYCEQEFIENGEKYIEPLYLFSPETNNFIVHYHKNN